LSWVRVDDQFPDHPKLMRLGKDRLAGMGLWVVGLCYCARFLTDGYIPAMALPWGSRRIATLLVSVGLWDVEGDGYRIHDYHEYQPTKAAVLEKRAELLAGKVAGGKARAASAGRDGGRFAPADHQQTTSSPAGDELVGPHQQTTSPIPIPSKQVLTNVSDWVEPAAFFEERTGRRPSQKVRDWLEDLHARFSRRELLHAMTVVPDPKATDWLKKVDAYLEAAA
jgi:hypothetical protein